MTFLKDKYKILLLLLLLSSCQSSDDETSSKSRRKNATGSYLGNLDLTQNFQPDPPLPRAQKPYIWESVSSSKHHKITKEHFRCKGSGLNPVRVEQGKNGTVQHYDCSGSDRHGLPVRNGHEFVYPILTKLLNYVQNETGKQVVVTSGHRCPTHNTYVDSSKENDTSKHMIGAEVSFFVRGLEDKPEEILALLKNYYRDNPNPDLRELRRYEKSDSHVSTPPWYNKEIYIKIHKKDEGRNFDNRHPYPYVSIQVRWDEETNERVIYNWHVANQQYLRR